MSLKDIVNVNIDRQTKAVSQAGFGTALIVGTHKNFPERLRYYSSTDSLSDDGFASNDPVYKAVEAYSGQDPQPPRVAVARRAADVANIPVTAVNATVYTITLNGTLFS